jgi:hypothetical protein
MRHPHRRRQYLLTPKHPQNQKNQQKRRRPMHYYRPRHQHPSFQMLRCM